LAPPPLVLLLPALPAVPSQVSLLPLMLSLRHASQLVLVATSVLHSTLFPAPLHGDTAMMMLAASSQGSGGQDSELGYLRRYSAASQRGAPPPAPFSSTT